MTFDINRLDKTEIITDKQGPQRRNYAEHMENKNALRKFHNTQDPDVFDRKNSVITTQQDSVFVGYNNMESNMFNKVPSASQTNTFRATPEISTDQNHEMGQAKAFDKQNNESID